MKFGDQLTGRGIHNPTVLAALEKVPRHLFVPPAVRDQAYADSPLPIACGQTISQPFIVASMTELLALPPQAVVLEIGTGCGYQTAVLAEIAKHVYSVEIHPELSEKAGQVLEELGYRNVTLIVGDGHAGLPQHAPYDGILVTAAAETLPEALIRQLKPGARLVIPIGAAQQSQILRVVEKQADGSFRSTDQYPVRFVPLVNSEDSTARS